MALAAPDGHPKRIGAHRRNNAPAPTAPPLDRDGLRPAPSIVVRGARWWVLVHFGRGARVHGLNAAGDPIVEFGDVVGVIEYVDTRRALRALVPCVRCHRRTPSPVVLLRRRRDLRRPLKAVLCARCSQPHQR
jgi:hypothetical protein